MGNTMDYYWNQNTVTGEVNLSPGGLSPVTVVQPMPDTRAYLTQAQNNIVVTPLTIIETEEDTCNSIHDPESAIGLCLVTKLEPLKLNNRDLEYINSRGRDHIDFHYVNMLKSRPIQKNKTRPTLKSI